MGVMCQIFVNHSPEGVFRPGNQVTGVVRYALDKELKCKAIIISLHGKGHCHWEEYRGAGSNRRTIHYKGSEEICNIKTDVLPKQKQDDTVTIEVGSYNQPFTFVLPENIPSSYGDDIGTITYLIKVKFARPGIFASSKRFEAEIMVQGNTKPILPQTPLIYGFGFESNMNITLKGEIEKSFLFAGEKAQLKFSVTNDIYKNTIYKNTIVPIEIALNSVRTYTSNGGRKQKYYNTVKCKTTFDSSTSIATTPELFSLQNSSIISVEYKIVITVRMPMPHFDAKLEMPIVICPSDCTSFVDQNIVKKGEEAAVDAPPSYWKAIRF